MTESVVQSWLQTMSLKQQTVVLCALRGCDGLPKEDQSKALVRWIRGRVLKDAHDGAGDKTFMRDSDWIDAREFTRNMDHYPVHWLLHVLHAMQLIGNHHPTPSVRDFAHVFYVVVVDAMHLIPEYMEANDERLRDVKEETDR